MGYLGLPEKTESTLDNEGWLHSGDIANIDEKGYVVITGRIKVKNIQLSKNLMTICIYFLGIINHSWWREYTSCIN